MQSYEIKEMIIELENEISHFQDCLAAYKDCDSFPPFVADWKQKIADNELKIKELQVELFDSIQKPNSVGRPSLGVTKKVSITLPENDWDRLEEIRVQYGIDKKSEFFREVLQNFIKLVDRKQ